MKRLCRTGFAVTDPVTAAVLLAVVADVDAADVETAAADAAGGSGGVMSTYIPMYQHKTYI